MRNKNFLHFLLLTIGHLWISHSHAFEGVTSLSMGKVSYVGSGELSVDGNPANIGKNPGSGYIYFALPKYSHTKTNTSHFKDKLEDFLQYRNQNISAPNAVNVSNMVFARDSLIDKIDMTSTEVVAGIVLPKFPVGLTAYTRAYRKEVRHIEIYGETDVSSPATPILASSHHTRALTLLETGASLSKQFGEDSNGTPRWSFGIRPKLVSTQTHKKEIELLEYGLTQPKTSTNTSSWFDLDLGLIHDFSFNWSGFFEIENALTDSPRLPKSDMKPYLSLGSVYSKTKFLYTTQVDLTRSTSWIGEKNTRRAAFGTLYRLNDRLNLSGGLGLDAETFREYSYSLGIHATILIVDLSLSYEMDAPYETIMFQVGLDL
ncbi:MAG: conjugal transfer protein TraF [Gammaproteobacteria bacterium]|nr:conjugal transfer protein TraF [Gammaproteobacteria bacterium]MDH5693593.1 conjugal transfer protein TraF [Gammaproteobacteria bacterium]